MIQPSPSRPGRYRSALTFLTVAAASCRIAAQSVPGSLDQINNNQQQRQIDKLARSSDTNSAPELYPGESDDVGPQSILALKPKKFLFDVMADTQYYYSDNALLDHDNRQSSGVLVSTIQAALAPSAYPLWGGALAPRIGIRQQWYDFIEYKTENPNLNSDDFVVQTAFVDERWSSHNWTLGVGFDASRLVSTPSYNQFYREYLPRWEISKLVEVGRKANIVLSYQGNYHFTSSTTPGQLDPPPPDNYYDRFEEIGQISLVWSPRNDIIVQPFYALRYTSYHVAQNREDKLNSVGLSVYWLATQNVSLRAFTSFEKRFSNVEAGEYTQFSAGVGLNLDLRF